MTEKSKKRKLNLEDNKLENKFLNLHQYKKFLNRKEIELKNELNSIRNLKKETNILIAKKCEEENNGHKWIREKEDCMYGSSFTYCKKCGADFYDRSYFH